MLKSLRVVACIAALWVIASTFGTVWLCHRALPTLDHWVTVELADRTLNEGLAWAQLWMQHNEHRLLVPRLLFLLDFLVFQGRGLSLLATTVLVQLAHGIVLWRLLRAAAPAAGAGLNSAVFLAVALFSSAQMFNFIEPFQVQFMLVHAAATVAILVGVAASRSGRASLWLVAMLAAFVAATSMANGLVVWPLLAVTAWLRRGAGESMQVKQAHAIGIACITVAATAMVIAYLSGFKASTSADLDPTQNLRRPWRILAYAMCWVGSPFRLWDGEPQVLAGGIAGGLAMAAFAALAGPVLWRRGAARGAAFTLAMAGTFLLATAFVMAAARSGGSLMQAQADRYATPCHLFWVMLCGLGVVHASVRVRRITTVVAAVVALVMVWQQGAHVGHFVARQSEVRRGETGVVCGVRDTTWRTDVQLVGFIEPMYDVWLPILQQRRWSVFAEPRAAWVGRKVTDAFAIAPADAAISAIDGIEPVAATGWGCRVRGFAWDSVGRRAPQHIVLASDDGVIVGLAETWLPRPEVQATHANVTDPLVGWTGYAALSASRRTLRAWVVLADGRACPGALAPPVLLAALTTSPPRGVIADSHFLAQGATRPFADDSRAATLGIVAGPATLDADFGRIDVGPLPARAGVVGLPIQVGPNNWGMSVHLVDLVTFRQLATIHPPPTHGDWAIWRVEITPDMVNPNLGFIAIDRGARPGQWIAVGAPVLLD